MSLKQLIRVLNTASEDAREVLLKIKDITTHNGNTTITFYDGTTITTLILKELQRRFDNLMGNNKNEVKDMRNREFYVDAVNGSDDIHQKIGGIVRDSNGVPRNILSNIAL